VAKKTSLRMYLIKVQKEVRKGILWTAGKSTAVRRKHGWWVQRVANLRTSMDATVTE
jgi:hypothetical protein